MGRPARSIRKRFASQHRKKEVAGREARRRKIIEKQIMSTADCERLRRIKAQIACHRVFDRLWSGAFTVMPRRRAYEYLHQISGFRHIKHLNVRRCRLVAEQVKKDFPQLFCVQWRIDEQY